MEYQDLSGLWQVRIPGLPSGSVRLPGTLDEGKLGFPDAGNRQWHPDSSLGKTSELMGEGVILTRLTRNYSYEGPAFFTKTVTVAPADGGRLFLEAERSRELTLAVNGRAVAPVTPGCISAPYVFEVTADVQPGENEFTLCCDNSYPSWNHDAIFFSSAATDETQTNWNGILGYLRLRYEKRNFIAGLRVYPRGDTADLAVTLDLGTAYSGVLRAVCPAFLETVRQKLDFPAGKHVFWLRNIRLNPQAGRWDEDCGIMHDLTLSGDELDPGLARFGIRDFRGNDGKLALNGRHIFLRSEANCCVFPATGHMPMTAAEWETVLAVYRSYGVNCMRFHSHCPPEAAFTAADGLGMLMQPELSHWNPRTAFEDEAGFCYYRTELEQILLHLANHPSFVMMTLGNELTSGALGLKRMGMLIGMAKNMDTTRLYAIGSNNYCENSIGTDPFSDFYTSACFYQTQLRGTSALMTGHINQCYPGTGTDYSAAMKQIRTEFSGPVFGFEVGQYEVLPDFDEWAAHQGVTRGDNYLAIRRRAQALGFLPEWKKRVEATGELALLAYREEVEAALRTGEFSGLSLLSLQDFPGQGTALVGMLNAHLQPKPFDFARPERFKRFFNDRVPLVLMEKYTWRSGEEMRLTVKIANYRKEDFTAPCTLRLMERQTVLLEAGLPERTYPCGTLSDAGAAVFSLAEIGKRSAKRLSVVVQIGEAENDYPVWIYPEIRIAVPESVLLTRSPAEAAAALREGKTVFLTPPAAAEHFPLSIKAQFTTDFWSVGTFAGQSGFMGCLIDPAHPVFAEFPTEFHSNWQWWAMCQGRAMILPEGMTALVTALDCYARMRNLGMLTEVRAGAGKLMLSSMGLLEQLQYPEAGALLQSILNYMASRAFRPEQELPLAALGELVR